jgi:hypothetical protein
VFAPFGGERAFDGGFQQRLPVAHQLGLRGFQFGHAGVEIREQFFELFDDAGLFHAWWNCDIKIEKDLLV